MPRSDGARRRPLGTTLRRLAARLAARGREALRTALHAPRPEPERLELEAVRRRLELLIAALYDRPMGIEPTERPPAGRLRGWLARRRSARAPSLAATDGDVILLPPSLGGGDVAHYRLLALEQAERVARGTVAHLPATALERDLYLVAEGAAVDRALARGGTRASLEAARAAALSDRPPLELMPPLERAVERLLREALAGRSDWLPDGATPADSLHWARESAARLRAADDARYHGVPPVALWGAPRAPGARGGDDAEDSAGLRSGLDAGGSGMRPAGPDQPGDRSGPTPTDDAPGRGPDDPTAEGEAPEPDAAASLVARPATKGDPDDAAAPERRGIQAEEPGDDLPPRGIPAGTSLVRTQYPEWDVAAQRYRAGAVTVHQWRAPEAAGAWARDTLQDHAALVRRVRQRFERLRAQRVRLTQQRDGAELDLAACVRAAVDRRLGHAVDDRLYTSVRPARRGLAITLLVDVSGSTDTIVSGSRQVIDVEKTATLLACEALEALGDPYAVLAFSSRGARRVWLRTVKDFGERHGDAVRRRLAALEPEANTRLGAAVRHATTLLTRQPAGHRLLLIVSDGRPNDIDHYQERFAVEDSRQAMAEARAAGVHPFCLTVDREQSDYLPRIFGAAGYTIMRQPDHLPMALLKAVRELVSG